MKKNTFIVITVILMVLVLAAIGCKNRPKEETSRKQLVLRLSPSSEVTFTKRVRRDLTSPVSNRFAGNYLFEDSVYEYNVSFESDFVEFISQKLGQPKAADAIVLPDTAAVEAFCKKNYGDLWKGDLVLHEYEDPGSKSTTYELIETANGFETGTRCSLDTDADGILVSAAFLLGNYDYYANKQLSDFISKEEAREAALEAVLEYDYPDLTDTPEVKFHGIEFHNYTNSAVWVVNLTVFPDDEEFPDGKLYSVEIDAENGQLVNISVPK